MIDSAAIHRRRTPIHAALGALSFAFVALAGPAAAQSPAVNISSSCVASSGFGGSSPLFPDGQPFVAIPCVQTATGGNGALAIAEAAGDRGIWRADATAAFGAGENASAVGRSIWREEFVTIDLPGKEGQSGTFFYEMFLEGYLEATGAGRSRVQVLDQGTFNPRSLEWSDSATAATGPKPISQVIEGALTFKFGQEFSFQIELFTAAERSTNLTGAGFAESVFGGTGYFGGITRVLDQDGNAVQGFTFGGRNTGLDFGQSLVPPPVPAPPTVWMLAAGLVALTWVRRRQRGVNP